jgi:hypothetical protein
MLTLSEYLVGEPLPLATVQEVILDFCRDRPDLCVFGAQALALHTGVPRMTQDVDLMAEDPEAVAVALAEHLAKRFPGQMAAQVRTVRRDGRVLGYRVFQKRSAQSGGNRYLADVRRLDVPRSALQTVEGVQFTGAALTLAMKVFAATARSNALKRDQDRVDAKRLVLALPALEASDLEPLWSAMKAPAEVRATFETLSAEARRSAPVDDEDDFY